ncbi:MAG: SDR family oxidoreductase [Bacilli bacterium]|nr:SDR family oxidoreductase [Bacilli bacterium]
MKKTVLVTGSAKGIGAATIIKFAQNGYNVIINYLNSEEKALGLKEYVENNFQVKALLVKADVSKESEVKKMLEKILQNFETIDCVVNNAAITQDNEYYDKTEDEFNKIMQTNLTGTFLVCKHFGEVMAKQKSGNIINISSTNGIDTPETYSIDYNASKAGIISLTNSFAAALAPYVRVNTVAPGWTATESVLEMDPKYLESEKQYILLNRFGKPEEIANTICFLASDEASYITNSLIRVDGGLK